MELYDLLKVLDDDQNIRLCSKSFGSIQNILAKFRWEDLKEYLDKKVMWVSAHDNVLDIKLYEEEKQIWG